MGIDPMTDRYEGFIVVLERDIREDAAEPIMDAIRLLKGVIDVKPVVPDIDSCIAATRRDRAWIAELDAAVTRVRGSAS
jgi:hypothetical protein